MHNASWHLAAMPKRARGTQGRLPIADRPQQILVNVRQNQVRIGGECYTVESRHGAAEPSAAPLPGVFMFVRSAISRAARRCTRTLCWAAHMIALVYAHPYPDRSRANRSLLAAVRDLPGIDTRALYDMYPDFAIDVEAEQEALVRAEVVVWQHPLYWYSVPALLKHWFDKVLANGFAYGDGGTALRGKRCLWVTTAGGDDDAYSTRGMHAYPFAAFVPPIEQTARFCGMDWEEPFVVKSSHRASAHELRTLGERYLRRLAALSTQLRGEGRDAGA